MAKMRHYTKMRAMAVIAHQERTCQSHSNDSIDPERTKDNYAVWPYDNPDKVGEKHGWHRLLHRLSQVRVHHRKDVNVLIEWIIHLGVDVPPGFENEKAFFEACMRYCEMKYGKENIIYGLVHKDEETPHLTVGIVPVVKKERKLRKNASKKTREKYEAAMAAGDTMIEAVDADELISLKHLKDWHGGLKNFLIDALGYDPAVYTGITKELGGDMSVKAMKRKPASWREQRNKRAAAFHEKRRAEAGLLGGRKAGLDAVIEMANPNPVRPQAQPAQEPTKKAGLDSIIKNAKDRGGAEG